MPAIEAQTSLASRVVFYGQSLNILPLDPSPPYGEVASGMFPRLTMTGTGHSFITLSVLASGWADLEAAGTLDRVLAQPFATVNVLVMLGGQNDLFDGTSGAATYTLMAGQADEAKVAGFDYVVGCTIPPADVLEAVEAQRLLYNAAIRTDSDDAFDSVVDLAALSELEDTSDTRYFSDGTHFTYGGALVAARLVRPAVQALIAQGPVDPFSGGSASDSGGYRYRTFTSSSSLTVANGAGRSVDYLVVAGGGGGSRVSAGTTGGGGGGGGVQVGSVSITATQSITVGGGGSGATSDGTDGSDGSASSIGSLVSATGGGGGDGDGGGGRNGGCGGGGRGHTSGSAGGTGSQGRDGGTGFGAGTAAPRAGAGGGGALTPGGDGASATGGAGGAGRGWVNGSTYAGGGGGGTHTGTPGAGGSGGGGAGGNNAAGTAGTANTGGGGGGGGRNNNGGNGGSGIVIVRYRYPA